MIATPVPFAVREAWLLMVHVMMIVIAAKKPDVAGKRAA